MPLVQAGRVYKLSPLGDRLSVHWFCWFNLWLKLEKFKHLVVTDTYSHWQPCIFLTEFFLLISLVDVELLPGVCCDWCVCPIEAGNKLEHPSHSICVSLSRKHHISKYWVLACLEKWHLILRLRSNLILKQPPTYTDSAGSLGCSLPVLNWMYSEVICSSTLNLCFSKFRAWALVSPARCTEHLMVTVHSAVSQCVLQSSFIVWTHIIISPSLSKSTFLNMSFVVFSRLLPVYLFHTLHETSLFLNQW